MLPGGAPLWVLVNPRYTWLTKRGATMDSQFSCNLGYTSYTTMWLLPRESFAVSILVNASPVLVFLGKGDEATPSHLSKPDQNLIVASIYRVDIYLMIASNGCRQLSLRLKGSIKWFLKESRSLLLLHFFWLAKSH